MKYKAIKDLHDSYHESQIYLMHANMLFVNRNERKNLINSPFGDQWAVKSI